MKKNAEKGQATLELILMMLAMTACMMGVLFVGAITVSNNNRLLESKFEAEKKSRLADLADLTDGSEYVGWDESYRKRQFVQDGLIDPVIKENKAIRRDLAGRKQREKALHLPFGLDYTPQRDPVKNTVQDVGNKLMNPAYSRFQSDYYWETQFLTPQPILTDTDNAFKAAHLVSSHSTSEQIATGKFLRGADPRNYAHVERSMRETAHKWLGFKVSDSDIERNPSNRVYMPIIKVDKKIME